MEDLRRFVRDLKRDLDLIRQRVNNLETHEVPGGGAGSGLDADTVDGYDASDFASASHTHDASVITFTPAVAANWDGSADPGNVDNALDQLAERVTDVEGGSGSAPVGAENFTDLADVPSTYADQGGKLVAVNEAEDGLEFVDPGSGVDAAAIDGYAITGTPLDGRILRLTDAGGDETSEATVAGSLSQSSYDDRDVCLVAGVALNITAVTLKIYTATTYRVKVWDAAKTSLLAYSSDYVKPSTGEEARRFNLNTPVTLAANDYVYIELENDANARYYYLSGSGDRVSANGSYTLRSTGTIDSSVIWLPMTCHFIAGDLTRTWTYADPYLDVSIEDVSNPPTDAELDTAFGQPATVGAGFVRLLNDGGGDTAVYLVASNGISWWYAALTKAT